MMTNMSEKLTNEEVHEMAQWQDVDVIQSRPIHREDDGTVSFDDLQKSSRQSFMVLRNGQLKLG